MTSALISASISLIAPCGLLAAIFTGAAAHVLDMLNLLPFPANPLEEKASQLWANPALVKERRRKEAVEACPGAAPGVAGDPVVAGDPGVAGEDPAGAEDARKQRGRPAEGRPLQPVHSLQRSGGQWKSRAQALREALEKGASSADGAEMAKAVAAVLHGKQREALLTECLRIAGDEEIAERDEKKAKTGGGRASGLLGGRPARSQSTKLANIVRPFLLRNSRPTSRWCRVKPRDLTKDGPHLLEVRTLTASHGELFFEIRREP